MRVLSNLAAVDHGYAVEHSLARGQVGIVVETCSLAVYEVEFADEGGKLFAMVAF